MLPVNTRRGGRGSEGGCPLGVPPPSGMLAYLLQERTWEWKKGRLHVYGSCRIMADDDPRPGTADHTFPLISSTFLSTDKFITDAQSRNIETG